MGKVTLLYLPFELSTYTAVTTDSIEREAVCKFELPSSESGISELKGIFDNVREGSFNNLKVRFKATGIYKTHVYVDQDGGILWSNDSSRSSRLTDSAFKQLNQLMRKLYKSNPQACKIDVDYLLGQGKEPADH